MFVVLGDIAVDIVSRLATPLARGSDAPADIRVMPGGSGANAAVWLSRLGAPVRFIGRVGDDLFGRWLVEDLKSEGVQPAVVVDPQHRTGVIQVIVEPGGERTMVPDRGANAHWSASDVDEESISRAVLLHIVGYVLLDEESRRGALQAMAYARAHGVPISVDPSSHMPLQSHGGSEFFSLIGHPEILLPNRLEAQVLTGQRDPGGALDILLKQATVVAVKLDRDGCVAGTGSLRYHVPAPVANIVNATGAGDAFNAAFLSTWMATKDLAEACRAGVTLGTQAACLPGTR